MTSGSTPRKMSEREIELRKLLPASFKDIPFVQYHAREAETVGEYFDKGIEFGVKDAQAAGERQQSRALKPR